MDGAISCADHSREPSYSLLIFWIIYAPVGRSPRSQRGLCGGADGLHPAMARKERAMRLLKDFTGIGRRPASANSSDSHRSRPDSYRARRHRCTLGLERLEDRVALSNFVSSNLASFNGATGSGPRAGLTLDAQGNLYGTTDGGGANGQGTLFELAAGSGTITTLASFNGANGAYPEAGLIMDAQGNLYGTTSNGGAFDDNGTVFELAAGSNTITTLA